MIIYLGADHRGFSLKEFLKQKLKLGGHQVVDCGAEVYDKSDDYVDFAKEVAQKVSQEEAAKGIVICGSGHGVEIVANRFKGVRGILGFNLDVVAQGREHENANILSIPSDWVSEEEAEAMVQTFLTTEFSGDERHQRRLKKLEEVK